MICARWRSRSSLKLMGWSSVRLAGLRRRFRGRKRLVIGDDPGFGGAPSEFRFRQAVAIEREAGFGEADRCPAPEVLGTRSDRGGRRDRAWVVVLLEHPLEIGSLDPDPPTHADRRQ